MEPKRFKPADLKTAKFFYTYHPGKWEQSSYGTYRRPSITIHAVPRNYPTLSDPILRFTGQMDKNGGSNDRQSRKAYGLQAEMDLARGFHPMAGKILAETGKRFWPELGNVVRALKVLKIPLYVWHDRATQTKSSAAVPRPFKNRADAWIQARELVAVEA